MEMVHFIPPSQRRLAMLASQTDTAPVLIYGASGTGKGAIARWIHGNGPRATLPLVTSEKGKALSTQIPLAQGGTLVIHEIGSLPLGEQKTLLAFLNTRSLTMPNGVSMLLNVRIMVTTSQTLEGRAQCGLFNPELLKKLNVFRLEMPSLARRNEEFDDIVLGIIGEITRELHKEHLRSLSPGAWERLRNYDWPGNLRELRNAIERAAILADGPALDLADLPERIAKSPDPAARAIEVGQPVSLAELEAEHIRRVLESTASREEAAKVLGIDPSTLYRKRKQFGP